MKDLPRLGIEYTNWTDPAGLFWSTIGLPDGLYVIPMEQVAPPQQTDETFVAWVSYWLWLSLLTILQVV